MCTRYARGKHSPAKLMEQPPAAEPGGSAAFTERRSAGARLHWHTIACTSPRCCCLKTLAVWGSVSKPSCGLEQPRRHVAAAVRHEPGVQKLAQHQPKHDARRFASISTAGWCVHDLISQIAGDRTITKVACTSSSSRRAVSGVQTTATTTSTNWAGPILSASQLLSSTAFSLGIRPARGLHTSAAVAAGRGDEPALDSEAEAQRTKQTDKVRDLLMGMPFLPRNGVTAENVTRSASASAVRLHQLALQLHEALGGKFNEETGQPIGMARHQALVQELKRLGGLSRGLLGNCEVTELTTNAESRTLAPYTEWTQQDFGELSQLHESGALGAIEMGTVRKVLTMDPDAWSAAVISNAQAADAKERQDEEAHAKKLKEEEDDHVQKLLSVVDGSCMTWRSGNNGDGQIIKPGDMERMRKQIQSRTRAAIDAWPRDPEAVMVHRQGIAGNARWALSKAVIDDITTLAINPQPAATSNGRVISGPKGGGKSKTVAKLAAMAAAAIPDDAPFNVTVMYMSALEMVQRSNTAGFSAADTWQHCIGRQLKNAGAILRPDDQSKAAQKYGHAPMYISEWSSQNRKSSAKQPGSVLNSEQNLERLLLIVDEFDWLYMDVQGMFAAHADIMSCLERFGEVRLYLTGSPSISTAMLYEPHTALELFPDLQTRRPGLTKAHGFNPTKLIQMARFAAFNGDEALEFAFGRGRQNIREVFSDAIVARMPDFFALDRTQESLELLKQTEGWADLAGVLQTVRLTAREIEVALQASAAQEKSGTKAVDGAVNLGDVQAAMGSAAFDFCRRSMWTSAALTGLAVLESKGSLVSPAYIVGVADAIFASSRSSDEAKKWEATESGQKTMLIQRALLQACDDGIVDQRSEMDFGFSSPSHRVGAMQVLLGLPRHGWSAFAVAALASNPAGAYGLAAEALFAVLLQGTSVNNMLSTVASNCTGFDPPEDYVGMFSETNASDRVCTDFVPGSIEIISTTPDALPVLNLGKKRGQKPRKPAKGQVDRALGANMFAKENPDKAGGDLVMHMLRVWQDLLRRVLRIVVRMQFKLGATALSLTELQNLLVKMLIGALRTVDDSGASPILDVGRDPPGTEIVVKHVIVSLRPSAAARPPDSASPVVILMPGQDEHETVGTIRALFGESGFGSRTGQEFADQPQILCVDDSILKGKLDTACLKEPWNEHGHKYAVMLRDGGLVHFVPSVLDAAAAVSLAADEFQNADWINRLMRE